jgi:hypothetical protein
LYINGCALIVLTIRRSSLLTTILLLSYWNYFSLFENKTKQSKNEWMDGLDLRGLTNLEGISNYTIKNSKAAC